jgi:hypothetical protein
MTSDTPFWWFDAKATEKLREKLNAAGDGARLEIHHKGDASIVVVDGSLHLVVVPAGQSSHDPINDSHICPPVCP